MLTLFTDIINDNCVEKEMLNEICKFVTLSIASGNDYFSLILYLLFIDGNLLLGFCCNTHYVWLLYVHS